MSVISVHIHMEYVLIGINYMGGGSLIYISVAARPIHVVHTYSIHTYTICIYIASLLCLGVTMCQSQTQPGLRNEIQFAIHIQTHLC